MEIPLHQLSSTLKSERTRYGQTWFASIKTGTNYFSMIPNKNKGEQPFQVELPGHIERHRRFGTPLYSTAKHAEDALLLYLLLRWRGGLFTKRCLTNTDFVYLYAEEHQRTGCPLSYCILFRDHGSYFVSTETNPYKQSLLPI